MGGNDPSPFRIQPRILILLLILGIPPLVVGHLLLVSGAERRFQETLGSLFGQEAERLQGELVGHIEGVHVQVANLTGVAAISEAARASSLRRPDESKFAGEIRAIEQEWPQLKTDGPGILADILANPASKFLRDYNRVVATFREVLVADRFGRLVAASGKTTDYFQGDETWWRVAFLEGKGQRYISDIEYDESAGVFSIAVAEPIRDEASGEVQGILKAVVDDHDVFRILDSVRLGEEASAVLIRSDGSLVSSLGTAEKYEFSNDVFAAMDRGLRYVEVPAGRPGFFVGLPVSRMKSRIPELDWILLVESPRAAVFAPFANLRSWFVYIVVFSVALVVALSLVFSWILSKPIIETDPHLEKV